MIAVDTNVLVRYVTNDDPTQAAHAIDLIAKADEIFIAKTVLLELEWVLRAVYGLKSKAISKSILHVLGLPNVTAEDSYQVDLALKYYVQGLDFADALHLASSQQVEMFYTFDAKFARRAGTMGLFVAQPGS